MNYKIIIYTLLLNSCLFNNNEIIENEKVYIASANINQDSIFYQITNSGKGPIFITEKHFLIKDENGDYTFESYHKSSLMSYNQFIPPRLITLNQGKTIKYKTAYSKSIEKDLFVRIFNKDYNKTKSLSFTEYSNFEENNSFLIKVEINE